MTVPIRRRGRTLPFEQRRVEITEGDILVYGAMEFNTEILDAMLTTDKRLLWAFVQGVDGDVRAIPYSEEHVIWMSELDILQPKDVEI